MRQHRKRDQQLENAFIQVHAFEILEQPEIVNPEAEELPDTEMFISMNIDRRQLHRENFLFNLLKNQVNRRYGISVVKVGALTGVVARLIGVSTTLRSDKTTSTKNGLLLVCHFLLLKSPNACFGGINVFIFGDLMQLPPVRGHQVFQQPEHMKPAADLWRQFRLVELKQNRRQQGVPTFIDVLNALRVGKLTSGHFEIHGKVSTDD
ncbi:ATP-dependent DNA helicase [Caerostris extrusa]|uniref:ATP-dependent DNA helicase n=1 Tax=Caerostris extrusa TaxID=172846 RepID=A0AAV4XQX1_CAEEX|nr:ATP-dependent DNA helicase [Caerostris extrusa]